MLRTFDPFRDFDRLLARPGAVSSSVPMDVLRHEQGLEIRFDLPGVDPGSIDLTVEKGELVLSAERPFDVNEGTKVLVSERPMGNFQRRLILADTLDTDKLEARYDNGVLVITVPVAEAARPRRVTIGAVGGPEPIEAHASEG